MIINEIFNSIDGESKRAGEIATFIRTQGCCLSCDYCDSKYTWGKNDNCRQMTVDEIVNECHKWNCKNITFTGGEPLLQKDSDELTERLDNEGFEVSIETCGAVDFTQRRWFNKDNNVWVCADYKCHSSGQSSKMLSLDTFAKLREKDVLKFVVGSKDDLEQAYAVISWIRGEGCRCYCYLSPVFGQIRPVEIVEFMKHNQMIDRVRFQLQLHKFVWDPQAKGV